MMKRLAHVAIAIALAAGALSCIGAGPSPGRGDKLANVKVLTLDGKATSLAKVIGRRAVVLKFGATWCGPCTEQIPELNKVRAAYPSDKLAVIELDLGEPVALVKRHAADHGVAFTTVLDPTSKAAQLYGVTAIPVTLVAAPDGTILYRGGYASADDLKPHIDNALAPAPPRN